MDLNVSVLSVSKPKIKEPIIVFFIISLRNASRSLSFIKFIELQVQLNKHDLIVLPQYIQDTWSLNDYKMQMFETWNYFSQFPNYEYQFVWSWSKYKYQTSAEELQRLQHSYG